MLDTNALSLSDKRFAYPRSSVSHRHVVDAFATIAWFQGLAGRASASTVAEVMRFCERNAFISSEHRQMRHRQWSERSIGRRSPSPSTVAEVDALHPGSAAILQLVLWPALRSDWPVEQCVGEVCRCLPASHSVLLKALLSNDRPHTLEIRTSQLERTGTLQDLACLLVCLRQANVAHNGAASYRLSRRVNNVLLMQAGWLLEHGLLLPLIEYVDRHFYEAAPAPFAGIVSAATYFHQLRWLIKAVPLHYPEIAEGFDAETWRKQSAIALQRAGVGSSHSVRRSVRRITAAPITAHFDDFVILGTGDAPT